MKRIQFLWDNRERDVNPLSFLYGFSGGVALAAMVYELFRGSHPEWRMIPIIALLIIHKWLHTKHPLK